jgi:hypothetical protein
LARNGEKHDDFSAENAIIIFWLGRKSQLFQKKSPWSQRFSELPQIRILTSPEKNGEEPKKSTSAPNVPIGKIFNFLIPPKKYDRNKILY